MAMPRPKPRRTPQEAAALQASSEATIDKGLRMLKRALASVKSQYTGIDPETGELGETALHNLQASWDGHPERKRTPGIANDMASLGTLPSDLAPLLPGVLRKLNPISQTADDDEIRPPSIDQLARGTPLANAYSEAEPEGDQSYLENLVNFAPPMWAEEAGMASSRGKDLATRDMGLDGPPTDAAEGAADAVGTMAAQLPVPAAWLRRLRGIRGAAEAKSASRGLRSALTAPVEYLSPTVDPSARSYASGAAWGAISNYLGAEEEESEPVKPGFSAGGAISKGLLSAINQLRETQGLPVATSLDTNQIFNQPPDFDLNTRLGFGGNPSQSQGGPAALVGVPTTIPTTATPRTPTIGTGQTGFVPQNPVIPGGSDDISFGNDTIRPTVGVDVRTGEVSTVRPNMPNPASMGNPQFRERLQIGQAPPQAAPVPLTTQGAGIYGPMAGSTAPPRRISNPSDPQWWLTYGFGPEQNFYSDNTLPSSGVPGGG